MLKNACFCLIIFYFVSAKAIEDLKIFNLPKDMNHVVQKIIKVHSDKQKKFLKLLKAQTLKGKTVFAVQFPFYHINRKIKNNNWRSLSKNQIYFLALKKAKIQVSNILFNVLLGSDKTQNLKQQLRQIHNKQSKYYIVSEKVFDMQSNSSFAFISTATVHLNISILNLKKILDKKHLLYSLKSKFNILPMINLLNTKTGYVHNWWQAKEQSLFSLASTLKNKNLKSTQKIYLEQSPKQQSQLNAIFFDLKTQFLNYFAKKANNYSLYVFRPKKYHFQHFLPEYLLKNASFSSSQIAAYLNPNLVLNADINYQLDEQKQKLTVMFLFKIFKSSSKKIVVMLNTTQEWKLNSNNAQLSVEIKKKMLKHFKDLGDKLLGNLLNLKQKALLQAYESTLVIKGSLSPVDLYRFMSMFKFRIRETLSLNLQSLSQFQFYLKLNSTLKIKAIANKISKLRLPNYLITKVSIATDQNKIKFSLKKIKDESL